MTRKRKSFKRNKRRNNQRWNIHAEDTHMLNNSITMKQEFNNSMACTPQKLNELHPPTFNFVNNVVNRPHSHKSNLVDKLGAFSSLMCPVGNLLPAKKYAPIKIDVATQTAHFSDMEHVHRFESSPFINYHHHHHHAFHTPERKFIAPIPFGSSTPNIRMERMLNKVIANEAAYTTMQNKEFSANKQKLYNVMTPKSHRNVLVNNFKNYNSNALNNFLSPPQTFSPLCNVTPRTTKMATTPLYYRNDGNQGNHIENMGTSPVSSKSWRCSASRGRQLNKNSPKRTPKLSKFVKLTKELRRKYTIRSVQLLVDACIWFKRAFQTRLFRDKQHETTNEKSADKKDIFAEEAKITDNEKMFKLIQEELQELKNMIKDLKMEQKMEQKMMMPQILNIKQEKIESVKTTSVAPPPPPPPLPPPPPPPPMPTEMVQLPRPFANRKTNDAKPKESSMRPTISVDDILQVKLKKPCERKQPRLLTRSDRRHTAPIVSLDALKQVRLRPTIAKTMHLTIPSLPYEAGKQDSNSPISSLKRLLTNGSVSESRPKRMRHGVHGTFDRERLVMPT